MKKLTKEEKEQRKLESKEINKLNRSCKIVLVVIITFILLMIINNLVMYFSESYTKFYLETINNFFHGLYFYGCGYIDGFSIIYNILIIVICFVSFIIETIVVNIKKSIQYKNKIVNICNICSFIIIFLTFSFLIENCYYLHLPNLDTMFFKETKDKTYTKDDLINLNYYLKDKVLYYANNQDREDNSVIFDGNINEQIIKDLHNIDDEIPLLKGLYPIKSSHLNNNLKGIFGSSTYGLTHFYNTYFDYSMDKVIIFNTIAHEYVHTKGITRENETVFLSCLSGIKSDNPISNYAGYLEAFSRVNHALYDIDKSLSFDIEDEVVSKCLTSNYNELCELYTKNTEEYIPRAKKLKISSYYLKNYIGYEKELEESLHILTNGGGKLYIDGKKVSVDDIIQLITSESNKMFYYERDIDSDIYNELKQGLKNDRLFKGVYQENTKDEESEDKKDIEAYYLAPFKKYDSLFLNSKVASVDYSYERSARLFLEYFEKYGYK